ncbi:hypothetical protein K474DRAFT_1662214 [Panus rudis PR-1116 ss-1]|nr:hypothetical protein K474DRAFT_1662214 [Panus rudis PR-1116 ss-1]
MSSYARLPPALLDLTLQRVLGPANAVVRRPAQTALYLPRRYSHAVALKPQPPPHFDAEFSEYVQAIAEESALYARRNKPRDSDPASELHRTLSIFAPEARNRSADAIAQLEERVNALKNTITTQEGVDHPFYSEEEVLGIYEDLLAAPSEVTEGQTEDAKPVVCEETDILLVQSVVQRLLNDPHHAEGMADELSQYLTQRLQQLRQPQSQNADNMYLPRAWSPSQSQSHRLLVSRLHEVAKELDRLPAEGPSKLPVGIMTAQEWSALARHCARENDPQSVEEVLKLMEAFSMQVSVDTADDVPDIFASAGDVKSTEYFLKLLQPNIPTERQRDIHIKAHLRSLPPKTFPTDALALLHSYENKAAPAPQKTYTRLLNHLFALRTTTAHAHAWDLFAHMRYAAHPNPDARNYTIMIRACATPLLFQGVEPERALDLWTEMTVDHKIAPTADAYTAVILTCARSGSNSYVHEAFRLAKEMLDANRDAHGNMMFTPDRKLFKALLEGAKRIGDLGRARWLLAEMVKASVEGERNVWVDDEVMVHVFNAYATYRPPFRRAETLLKVTEEDQQSQQQPGASASTSDASTTAHEKATDTSPSPQVEAEQREEQPQPGHVVETSTDNFAHLPPQSRAELVAEVDALFSRIISESHSSPAASPEDPNSESPKPFRNVRLTPYLFNAYLSVHYAHSPISTVSHLFHGIFTRYDVPRNARSYVEVLERCASARKKGSAGIERKEALALAEDVWREWEGIEERWRNMSVYGVGGSVLREDGSQREVKPNARLVERANAAMIRLLSITGQLDRALSHIRSFVTHYPPPKIRTPTPTIPPSLRSPRIVLTAPSKPLVRLTTPLEVPDDTVPPLLTFPEVEILHHKMVAKGNMQEGIRYLKWVCKSYEGSLRIRRERVLKLKERGKSVGSGALVPEYENGEGEQRSFEESRDDDVD